MNGQYQMTFDSDGNVKTDNVVASKAHEHGPKEKQADMDILLKDHANITAWMDGAGDRTEMPAWMSDDQPPLADIP